MKMFSRILQVIFISHFSLFTFHCSAQTAGDFYIHGKLAGLKKGTSISVMKTEKPLDFNRAKSNAQADAFEGAGEFSAMQGDDGVIVETKVTKDGVLELRGHIDRPQLVTLVTNNLEMVEKTNKDKPEDKRYEGVRWTYTPVFLDNVEYTIGANKYELLCDEPVTDKCVITGGEVQNDFNDYNLMLKTAQGNREFLENNERDSLALKFIEGHPTSVVSVYLANGMLENGYNMSPEQIRHLESSITGCPLDTARYNKFIASAKLAEQTAAGNPVVDLDLTNVNGDATNLTSVIPQGKIVLVDFWASWCGICRTYTPEIKAIYSKFPREKFDVISVSCDTSKERWKTAMEKDQMPWSQYLLTKQGYNDFFAKYQTQGVPYLLLVNPNGKVICNPGSPEKVQELLEKMIGE